MNTKTELRAVSAPWHNGINLMVRQGTAYGVNMVMKEVDPGDVMDPTFCISMTEAQTLMDDLWNAGLRPTEGSGSSGSLRATEKHLADMRKIAFKRLSIQLEEQRP